MTEQPFENKKILVVEDNTINQFLVEHSLVKLGATSDLAKTGTEAIEKMKKGNYDLVLLDIQLPEMDGYEITAYIRNRLKSDVPILAMTAFGLQEQDEKCQQAGMNGCISKPFTLDGLYHAINKAFQGPQETPVNPNVLSNKDISVDISMLYEIAGDDDEYISTMITTFLDNMPSTIKKIEDGLAENNYDQVYKSAHYAKSSLSVIKISDTLALVQQIEKLAKFNTDVHLIPALLQEVKEKFSNAQQILKERFGSSIA